MIYKQDNSLDAEVADEIAIEKASELAPTRDASPPKSSQPKSSQPKCSHPKCSQPKSFQTEGNEVVVTQGDLPHWHQKGQVIFATYRLADSLPLQAMVEYKRQMAEWRAKHNLALTEKEDLKLQRLKFELMEQLLDKSLGSCILAQKEVREIVSKSFRHFDHQRYHIHDFVIMPNHVHVLFEPSPEVTLQNVLSSWKSYTAHCINQLLHREGEVWQRESFDRIVRDNRNYWNVVKYIARNPKHCHENEFELYLTEGRPNFTPMPNQWL